MNNFKDPEMVKRYCKELYNAYVEFDKMFLTEDVEEFSPNFIDALDQISKHTRKIIRDGKGF